MILDMAVAFTSAAVAILIYYTISNLAGRADNSLRMRRSGIGLPGKASRLVQQTLRTLKCWLGGHNYQFNWQAPYFTQPARCTWCGRHGPWRRIP